MRRGDHRDYAWVALEGDVYLGTVLRACPALVLDQWIAVIERDSGELRLQEMAEPEGWTARGGIAYSPCVRKIEKLPFQRDGDESPGYDEWLVFEHPVELGERISTNPCTFQAGPGRICPLVGFAGGPHSSDWPQEIGHLLWSQIERLNPVTYLADSRDHMFVASRKHQWIEEVAAKLAHHEQ